MPLTPELSRHKPHHERRQDDPLQHRDQSDSRPGTTGMAAEYRQPASHHPCNASHSMTTVMPELNRPGAQGDEQERRQRR